MNSRALLTIYVSHSGIHWVGTVVLRTVSWHRCWRLHYHQQACILVLALPSGGWYLVGVRTITTGLYLVLFVPQRAGWCRVYA